MTTPANVKPRLYTQVMEQLQEGYVAAVAASAGAVAEFRKRDVHKYDVELSRQDDVSNEEVAVRVQLNVTTQDPAWREADVAGGALGSVGACCVV